MRRPKRVLVVDDDPTNCELLSALLETLGHEPEVARDGLEALAKLGLDIDLVLLDVMMPGLDGFEVARRIRREPELGDLPIVMVTSLTGREDRLRAVEAGANDYIAKPIDRTELRVRTASLLRLKEAQDAVKQHQRELEETVQRRTAALRRALEEAAEAQRRTYAAHLDTIQRLALAAEYKDRDTAAHLHRMSRYCGLLAERLGLPPAEVELIRLASPMHDVGKIGIPDAILLKPGGLTAEEWSLMKQHTVLGGRLLAGSPSELLRAGEVFALSHHERWDGTGYPSGLAGEAIPLYGRICAVADVLDALTSERPYKRAYPVAEALEAIERQRGRHFDPQLVDLLLAETAVIAAIREEGS